MYWGPLKTILYVSTYDKELISAQKILRQPVPAEKCQRAKKTSPSLLALLPVLFGLCSQNTRSAIDYSVVNVNPRYSKYHADMIVKTTSPTV